MPSPKLSRLFALKHLPAWRRLVQAGYLLFILYVGWIFYLFYLWAIGGSETFTARPPAVEGFLPIGALVALKRFVLTGAYDTIHPAGLTIFLAALATGLLLRKGFCGWICPVGCVSNLAEWFSRKRRWLARPPVWIDFPMLSLKYLLLFFFAYLILWKMDLRAIEGFMQTPYNKVVDAKMLHFFISPSTTTLWVMGGLVVISFFLRNFWCRYLCPYGALLGLLALPGLTRISRKEENCINCGRCDRQCPGSIRVSSKKAVRSPECIGCLECVAVCPAEDCLSLTVVRRRRVFPYLLPAAVILLFLGFWLAALATGHWHSDVPLATLKKLYLMMDGLGHPR